MLDEVGEGVVQVACLLLENAERNLDAGGAKLGNPLATDSWVRILGGDDAACNSRGDESVGAGAGAAAVTAGFERDIGGGSDGAEASCSGLFQGDDLGVVQIVIDVSAFADDLRWISTFCRAHQHAAH